MKQTSQIENRGFTHALNGQKSDLVEFFVRLSDKLRPNFNHKDLVHGFTVIELLVVISIMLIMAGVFTVNLAGQRVTRSLNIAQNELVTNIRQIQSYTLSGRNLNFTQPVKYYVVRLDTASGQSDHYDLQAIYKDPSGNSVLSNVSTIRFPRGVSLTGISITTNGVTTTATCALVAFQTPFGKVLTNNACGSAAPPINSSYTNIENFVFNHIGYPTTSDSKVQLSLTEQASGKQRVVIINGITGSIMPQ